MKMKSVYDQVKKAISLPDGYLSVTSDDNLMSSVHIHGSFDPKSDWANNIYQNSMYFIFSITPAKGVRYYDPEVDAKVTVEMINTTYKIKDKFRKGTLTPDKAIRRIRDWMASAKPLKENNKMGYFDKINERLGGMRHGITEAHGDAGNMMTHFKARLPGIARKNNAKATNIKMVGSNLQATIFTVKDFVTSDKELDRWHDIFMDPFQDDFELVAIDQIGKQSFTLEWKAL